MDISNNRPPRVKSIYAYLKEALRFYDTDNPRVAQISFVIQLFVIFGGYIMMGPYARDFYSMLEKIGTSGFNLSLINSEAYKAMINSAVNIMAIMAAIRVITYFVSLFYGVWYYHGRVQPSLSGKERASVFFKRLPKLIFYNFVFYAVFFIIAIVCLTATEILAYIFPLFAVLTIMMPIIFLIIDTLFIFKDLLIVEFDSGFFRTIKKSLDVTKGCRKNVVVNALWLLFLRWILNALSMDMQNQMLALFIMSFMEVIFLLTFQRLTVLMYIDAASLEQNAQK
ncbi:MAG: hypothetical protein GXX10_03400 [Clostridiaceae bacterium]|nr:hypothetical protein [Clostridiaceae bacterium]